ncbi:hypothetical protein Moror_11173 [Moniliophthora roreri MCA 2997]|uniref:Uncharacterized protein n=1 Tax=Moniliophthora roreri (strain MCA 2997) TaxID=1381753 RepID=V2W797_MONRO|nr:hypothetical protein Moror_11173 [Moniliophthora roreri MCA 2997]
MVTCGRGQHARMHTSRKPPQKNPYPLAEAGDKEDRRGHTLKICSSKMPTTHDKDDRSDGGEVRSDDKKIDVASTQSWVTIKQDVAISFARSVAWEYEKIQAISPVVFGSDLAHNTAFTYTKDMCEIEAIHGDLKRKANIAPEMETDKMGSEHNDDIDEALGHLGDIVLQSAAQCYATYLALSATTFGSHPECHI